MIPHTINKGDIIFDDYTKQWGIVCVLHRPNNQESSISLTADMEDTIIGYTPCYMGDNDEWIEQQGYCETQACDAYPLVPNRYFWGEMVCTEINKDAFDEEHDYDFYCPERDENCWEFEVSD